MTVETGWWEESFVRLAGVASDGALGTLIFSTGGTDVSFSGIESSEAFGALDLIWSQNVAPSGVPTSEAFGTLRTGQPIGPVGGIPTSEAFGTPVVNMAARLGGIPSAEAFGTMRISANPVAFDVLGTAGAEGIGAITCSVTPAAGDTVECVVWMGAGRATAATYGASNLKMKLVGRVFFGNGQNITIFQRKNVPTPVGAQTINVTTTTGWAQAQAVAYKSTLGNKAPKIVTGSGTALSQAVAVPFSGRVMQVFSNGDAGSNLAAPTGATSRYRDNAGLVRAAIMDTNVAATIATTLGSSVPWGGIAVPLTEQVPSGPRLNDVVWTPAESSSGAISCTVDCEIGDYIFADLTCTTSTGPTALTIDGVTIPSIVDFALYAGSGSSIWRVSSLAPMLTAGPKVIQITPSSGAWSRLVAYSISGVTTIGATTKSQNNSASHPSHAVTLADGEFALQAFGLAAAAPSSVEGANIFDNPAGANLYAYSAYADESTTFQLGNTSVNWGSLITKFS